MTIAVVVPTNRPEQYELFEQRWSPLFDRHGVSVFRVVNGDDPQCHVQFSDGKGFVVSLSERPQWKDFIFTHTDAVRNFGFLVAAEFFRDQLQVVLTLDDDVFPMRGQDPIRDHLLALHQYVPISWFSTASEYMRGFPYGVREEAEVWVSHGVWEGVHDYDGPTQLVRGNPKATFYQGPIPKGCFFPCCGMNLAFKAAALPFLYFAPMGKQLGVQRFADIWMGLRMKHELDDLGKAVVTGHATVWHSRASNVLNNLEQEARGIKWNEVLWQSDTQAPEEMVEYLDLWHKCLWKWKNTVHELLTPSVVEEKENVA